MVLAFFTYVLACYNGLKILTSFNDSMSLFYFFVYEHEGIMLIKISSSRFSKLTSTSEPCESSLSSMFRSPILLISSYSISFMFCC